MKRNKTVSMIFSVYHVLLFLFIFSGCGSISERIIKEPDEKSLKAIGYDLSNPDEIFMLPAVLHEISGITAIDNSTIACIQDESGLIFFYDLVKKDISRQITFYSAGDYEDIARAGQKYYVLRSNGTLYVSADAGQAAYASEIRLKGIPHKDIEGLCYDSQNNRLLIAPKDKAHKNSGSDIKQGLYVFDLEKNELSGEPLFEFRISELKDFAASNNVYETIEYNKKGEPKKPEINFSPSAIAVHPVSGRLYLLSSEGYMLFVFNLNGTIEYISRLAPVIFNNAEGITFLDNGDMIISNEGQGGNATMLLFRYKR